MNDRRRDPLVLLAALGHASRYRAVRRLLEGDCCVGELAVAIGLSQSCTTRHVQVLERAGVVRSHREGKRVLIAIARDGAGEDALLDWLARDPVRESVHGRAQAVEAPHPRGSRSGGAAARPPGSEGAPKLAARPAREERVAGRERGRTPGGRVPPGVPDALAARAPEVPPAEGGASGTTPAPPPATPSRMRRIPDTLEDFLL